MSWHSMLVMSFISISRFLMNSNALSGISSMNASGAIAGGSITTATWRISSTCGDIQATNGSVSGKFGTCQTLACTGTHGNTTAPTTIWTYIHIYGCGFRKGGTNRNMFCTIKIFRFY